MITLRNVTKMGAGGAAAALLLTQGAAAEAQGGATADIGGNRGSEFRVEFPQHVRQKGVSAEQAQASPGDFEALDKKRDATASPASTEEPQFGFTSILPDLIWLLTIILAPIVSVWDIRKRKRVRSCSRAGR